MVHANGAAGDVNPITKTVRQQLDARRSFVTMTGASYFGSHKSIEFADRAGGTFEECEEIGHALGDRIVYVAEGIKTQEPPGEPWSRQALVNHLEAGEERIETMAVGISDFGIVAEPGEILVEPGLDLKAKMRAKGYRFPWVVSYANDWQSYLATESVHIEGGYEAMMAQAIMQLMQNREQARIIGQRARQHAKERFSIRQHVTAVQHLYQELLASTRPTWPFQRIREPKGRSL